jgi:hypothetical protein
MESDTAGAGNPKRPLGYGGHCFAPSQTRLHELSPVLGEQKYCETPDWILGSFRRSMP